MRQPTPDEDAYRWWREALAGLNPPIHEDEPHAGYFKCRRSYRGPFFPASIRILSGTEPETGELDEDEQFICEVNGEWANAYDQWQFIAKRPISFEEYTELQTMAREIAS